MKKILLFVMLLSASTFLFAQEHKIVFDFAKNDTASFATMVRQAKNIMNASPGAKLEIVCHGPGLDLLMKEKSTVQKDIEELQAKFNIVFAACENTMKRRGIDKSQLVPQTTPVPVATLEISAKQQQGWSYIKFGY